MEELIKSKERVQQHGEVFTPAWMVDLMLDIPKVQEATEAIDATFLEPAAGDGNFLVALLTRKLAAVDNLYSQDIEQCKRESLWALASIYGIEFLEDNHHRAQERMLTTYTDWWNKTVGNSLESQNDFYLSAKFLIEKNIVRGDTLEQKHPETKDPILFFEWKRTHVPMQVSYRQERLDSGLESSDNLGSFYNEDSGHQQAVAESMFSLDFDLEQTLFEGTIEITKVYQLEEK